jgi:hypothetical protein
MKSTIYEAICRKLLEMSSGDGEGVPTDDRKKNMGNRGFGSRIGTEATAIESDHIGESECCDEVTPPGEENLVKKLKKKKGVDNPWALAWKIHNKKK